MDKILVALIFLTWASVGTIAKISHIAGGFLDQLSLDEWRTVHSGIRVGYWFPSKRSLGASLDDFPDTVSDRLLVGLGDALGGTDSVRLYDQYLSGYSGSDQAVMLFCAENSMRMALTDAKYWSFSLPLVRKLYRKGIIVNMPMVDRYYAFHRPQRAPFNIDVAAEIAREPRNYPRTLVFHAADRCQVEADRRLTTVADISSKEKWFERT
jgi:hypothetical protein